MNRIELDLERCVHCQDCVLICPVGVWDFRDRRVTVAKPDFCLGPECGQCADSCWKMAITVSRGSGESLAG